MGVGSVVRMRIDRGSDGWVSDHSGEPWVPGGVVLKSGIDGAQGLMSGRCSRFTVGRVGHGSDGCRGEVFGLGEKGLG